ncbi:hypothetical protein DFH27DRAFT_359516 [Peziza echinospora]|nr:hypothetical protein DFH27DRAFT_359516 [Peziza echinospora]
MKLFILTLAFGVALTIADPWNARPGRGAYRRAAEPEPVPVAAPDAWNARPGRGAYKRSPEPVPDGWDLTPRVLKNTRDAVAEAQPYHYRPGEDIYTYSWTPQELKRNAAPTAAPVPLDY